MHRCQYPPKNLLRSRLVFEIDEKSLNSYENYRKKPNNLYVLDFLVSKDAFKNNGNITRD